MSVISPQPGPQTDFLTAEADIVIYGGAAGCGKSFAMLIQPLKHIGTKGFNSIVFRRTSTEITTPGGLWDEANTLYSQLEPAKFRPRFRGKPDYSAYWDAFGSKVKFSHLEFETDCQKHQGGQYCMIGFDELTTFTEYQFFFLMSRNRSTCGIKPHIRCTCNPDAGSWVRKFIDWWINPDTGYPIKERSNKPRYFTRKENQIVWVDKKWRHPETGTPPKSVTFIPGKLDDNKILVDINPDYKTNLLSMDRVGRERFYGGNWNIREEDGMFAAKDFVFVDPEDVPGNLRWIRYWDRAATEKTEKNKNPDETAGALCALDPEGNFYIKHVVAFRGSSADNEKTIADCANMDGRDVVIGLEQEPGSAGKDVVHHYATKVLSNYVVREDRPSGDKVDRAKPWAALAGRGQVKIVRGDWNRKFLDQVVLFPPQSREVKKDMVDAISGCFKLLAEDRFIFPNYGRRHRERFHVTDLPHTCVPYCSLWQEKDMTVYGVCMMWDQGERKLYVFDEFVETNPTTSNISAHIRKQARGGMLYGNERLFKDGDNIGFLLGNAGHHIHHNARHEEGGALMFMSDMITKGKFVVSDKCYETDRQYREWIKEHNKPAEYRTGCCRAVMLVISELKEQGKIDEPPEAKAYRRKSRWTTTDIRQNIASRTGVSNKNRWLV